MAFSSLPFRTTILSKSLASSAALALVSMVMSAGVSDDVLAAKKIDKTTTGAVAHQASASALSRGGSVNIAPASATLKRGLKALDKRDTAKALKALRQLRSGTLENKVLAWSIAMRGKGVGVSQLNAMAAELSDWPASKTIRANIERALVDQASGKQLRVAFSASNPETYQAAFALAKAHLKAGNRKTARKIIAPHWRNDVLKKGREKQVLRTFKGVLTRGDHRARVEYLLRKRRIRAAERVAGLAGATRLVAARAAVERKQKSASKKLAAVPASQKLDANYLLSKAKYLRRKERVSQAAKVLMSAPRGSIHENARNQYATEQRIIASDLVDAKKYKAAYRLMARNVALSDRKKMDSEFFAGWIALRKIGDAASASAHFKKLIKIASTPISLSRGHYWLARAEAKTGNRSAANMHFAKAAKYDTTFYGQLAMRKLGKKRIGISKPAPSQAERARFPKYELVQAIAKLESAGHPKRARTIYRHLARHLTNPGELALLSARAERKGDHQLGLQVGKSAFIRGKAVDSLAWPVGAIPVGTRTGKAGLPLAYAISRQESTFQVDARSHANALGLMQLLPGTARATARRAGVRYSRARLTSDAGYNALLGTTYLGEQMDRFGGSYILTFVAYNAGPSRATNWVARNGDPRGASLDFAIDWIEQIPFSETRNYVQRVMENLQVYNARLKGRSLTIDRDLVRGSAI